MDSWIIAILVYSGLSLLTLIPTIRALLYKIKLKDEGVHSFDTAEHFSVTARKRLTDHYSRLKGTLEFWKKRAEIYTSFHYYCIFWTILSAWAVPLISAVAPQVQGSNSKWLIVLISSHVALALSFHKGMKVADGMRAFRLGESMFYDLYRRLLDRPQLFGKEETRQIDKYFAEVERIRMLVRFAETESTPDLDSIKPYDHDTT